MLNSLILLNVSVVNLLQIRYKRWADWVCPCVPVCLSVNKQEPDTCHNVNTRHKVPKYYFRLRSHKTKANTKTKDYFVFFKNENIIGYKCVSDDELDCFYF